MTHTIDSTNRHVASSPLSKTTVAVVAHNKKTLGGGLGELRTVLASHGITDPIWLEVPKSSKAPAVRRSSASS